MQQRLTRRHFLKISAYGAGSAVLSVGLSGCGDDDNDATTGITARFDHGVASGDPTTNALILWTRVTPETDGEVTVSWEVATDRDFTQLVTTGSTVTDASRDYTVKVDAAALESGQSYFYRFKSGETYSATGHGKTLPVGAVDSVRFGVVSCANYPAGHFHAYRGIAEESLDAVLHLGDYLYEYGQGGYATEDAAALGREVQPAHELLSLSDYRTRYAQYRTDPDLQAAHAAHAFIAVWDDHEIANDAWREGAENHNEGEGEYDVRQVAALQAYFEWLPIRPPGNEAVSDTIYRSFAFGDLVGLHMLDTRVIGRDQQLDYGLYLDPATGAFDAERFVAEVSDPNRTLLGAEQLTWLQGTLLSDTATWQVLGQQILMGRMVLPAAIATQQMSIQEFADLAYVAQLAQRAQAGDTLTQEEQAYLIANAHRLTPEVIAALQLPSIPYNLDAWDGYAYEREVVLGTALAANANLVVLAGDTHNAWANNLSDIEGKPVGVEFATASVSSPGLEEYLGIAPEEVEATEAGIVSLVSGLEYLNAADRGYMTVTFTADKAEASWQFVRDIKSAEYALEPARAYAASVTAGNKQLDTL
ncbi:alkaline phosphatase D family protein [Ferrimonas balearica]|uniref:alkaline phosphatase D family protein n=1 Tax=Ferrimonas balearica TaxID=44012 RepID=UPI001C98F30C|nr:alkaline phosphatase D family protein [Ferrimonas balearica]MBY5920526.1 alkaline phosphatase D family protein [Ferrimonas balearica]MBY5996789.1 alkaline phosphatase D family protein [Ferrimonas balearica]